MDIHVGRKKLDEKKVLEIKELLYIGDLSVSQIAQRFDVSCGSIYLLNKGVTWSYIGDYSYPIKEISNQTSRVGEQNNNAKTSDKTVMSLRNQYVSKTLKQVYNDNQDILNISFSTFQKIIYGDTYRHLPVYNKRIKKWISKEPVSTSSESTT